MNEKAKEALEKRHPIGAYILEIGGGAVALFADKIFGFQGAYEHVYDSATNLLGLVLVMDGTRRIGNIPLYYKGIISRYLSDSKD